MNSNPTPDPTHGLSVQQADALWDAVAIPGPQEPTFPVQHERVCRAVAGILDELAPAAPSAVDQTTRDRIAEAPVKQRADCTELEWAEQERARFERLYTRETVRADLAEARADTAARDADIYQQRLERLGEGYTRERKRAEAMERAMESTAADALAHRGCHRDLMGQCLRAERAEAEVKRLTADRAAVLREAADRAEEETVTCPTRETCLPCGARAGVALELRRLADEARQPAVGARQPDTETQAGQHAPGKAALCADCSARGRSVCLDDDQPEWARPETEEEKLAKCRRMAKAMSAPPVAPPAWATTTEWPNRHKRRGDRRVHATAPFETGSTRTFWTACGRHIGEGGYPLSHMPVDCRECRLTYLADRDEQRAQAVHDFLAKLTPLERALFHDAAVMGYVQGLMRDRAEGCPKDSAVMDLVADACFAFPDLYQGVNQIAATTAPTPVWQIETKQRGEWRQWVPDRDDEAEARGEYDAVVAQSGHRWAYRLVRSDTTRTIHAHHDPEQEV